MTKRTIPAAITSAAMLISSGAIAQELTVLTDNNPDAIVRVEVLTAAFSAQHPGVTFEIETRPGGGEGDNIIKTRLATGEMADIFNYNSGSLLQALKPSRTLVSINDISNFAAIHESFVSTVSDDDGNAYGVPVETGMGGGIFYHRPTYESLGLSVPTTWAAFMENNAKIKAAGDIAPIAQTYRDTWTSQLFVLADFYNVLQEAPNFPTEYTGNKAKYASTPAAAKGFERLQEAYEAGYFNEDFGAASYQDGLKMIATGEAAHFPMLTFAIGAIKKDYPDYLHDVGFFAQPGDDPAKSGLTVWMPGALFIPKSSEHVEIAKEFVNFVATVEACDLISDALGATGPYLIKGCTLPANVPPAVADMLPYFEDASRNAPALEFLSPVKGPSLEQFTVEVGSGIRNAADAAALYDRDVEKQAKQLRLPGW